MIRPKTLWRLPLYCAAASAVSWPLTVRLFMRFAVVEEPEHTFQSDGARVLMVYALVFAAAVLLGWRAVRGMTRPELLLSATIAAALQFALWLIQRAMGTVWYPLSGVPEWSRFVPQLLFQTGALPPEAGWFDILFGMLTPYIFVLFGTGGVKRAGSAPASAS